MGSLSKLKLLSETAPFHNVFCGEGKKFLGTKIKKTCRATGTRHAFIKFLFTGLRNGWGR